MKKIFFILALCSFNLSAMEGGSSVKRSKIDQARPLTASELVALGDSHKKQGDWQKAVESYEAALPISRTLKELYEVNVGLAYIYGPENPKASRDGHRKASFFFENCLTLLGHFKAEDASQSAQLDKKRRYILRNLTHACFEAGNYENAIKYGKIAHDQIDEPVIKAYLCKTIGLCYRPTDLNSSIIYLEKGINLLLQHHNGREAGLYSNTEVKQLYGELLKELANNKWLSKSSLKEAKANYQTSLKFIDSTRDRADIWVQLGLLFMKEKNNDMARAYFETAAQDSIQGVNPHAYTLAKKMLETLPKSK